jgi:hypothetical protein
MADQNEALPPPAAPAAGTPGTPGRPGRRKKPRVPQKLCRGSKGRWARCPELGARVKREHRRVCRAGEPITCPRGSNLVRREDAPGAKGQHGMKGRGEGCLLVPAPGTKQGPARFVAPMCASKARSPLRHGKEPPTPPPPASTSVFSPPAPKARDRGPKVLDWSKCDCAPGLAKKTLASGAIRCQDPKTSRFQKAICAEAAYLKPQARAAQKKAPARRKSS